MDGNMCASCVFFCILSSKYNGFESSVSEISFVSIHIYDIDCKEQMDGLLF